MTITPKGKKSLDFFPFGASLIAGVSKRIKRVDANIGTKSAGIYLDASLSLLMMRFSRRDICTCDTPISRAISDWVLSWK